MFSRGATCLSFHGNLYHLLPVQKHRKPLTMIILAVTSGLCCRTSQPSLQLHATAFTITTSSSRAFWTCIRIPRQSQSTCLPQTQLHKNMQGGISKLILVTWRKSGGLQPTADMRQNQATQHVHATAHRTRPHLHNNMQGGTSNLIWVKWRKSGVLQRTADTNPSK